MVKYIIAIATVSLFGLLFLIGICTHLYKKSKQRVLWARISAAYNDNSRDYIDYDFGYGNDAPRVASTSRADGQMTIEDVLFEGAVSPIDEGIEEITGNYNPD